MRLDTALVFAVVVAVIILAWATNPATPEPYNAAPRVIEVPQADHTAEEQEYWDQWRRICKPTRVHDRYGVVRWVYTKQGCEFGVFTR
jgi:hypothetical protein